ncbi:D-hexose-6-phosphate mutarotase [Oscillochloris sp. ZM17-4]|uniref:D-hexose-6-phosphate mutarotase n=1 Tax=Oscillochloris sp. ZM17-4 TaxID=2866714 RepID=UPI001C7397AA|nr:D-hexose-6-phosphate mutarotase [Oscillochloris sp. ZM17-4]MBX0329380.1 D-hexose-6-phosphate mutarotase [Oscillochloris sp. ZM17-4]
MRRHEIPDRAQVVDGPGGLPHLLLSSPAASAEVALQGGQVLRYARAGGCPALWVSRAAVYAPGKAVRGGVPVCWPWFGPHPSDPAKPQHGFARTMLWELRAIGAEGDLTWARLGLRDDEATRALWPHAFDLELTVRAGEQLDIALTTRNTGDAPLTYGGALHSYLAVGDVAQIMIDGLDGARYHDKVGGGEHAQAGPVTISGEVDRVYHGTTAACAVRDPALGRRVTVAKAGSRTTVIWNPGPEKARQIADMAGDEYAGMVCVEAANAADDTVTLAPGAAHTLRTVLGAEG